jgi:glycosyltransferase involved in cell wall biosynthesis
MTEQAALRIVLFDAYHTGSHKRWALEARGVWETSGFEVVLLTLPGRHWKWRMQGAAAWFAEWAGARDADPLPDALVVTDMVDAAALRGLLPPRWRSVPMAVYFHENQITYPWSPTDPDPESGRDRTYGWINLRSALAADQVWFNSHHHREVFLAALPDFVRPFPDTVPRASLSRLHERCSVLHPPVSLGGRGAPRTSRLAGSPLLLLWNHRWEYDKAPERFFAVVGELDRRKIDFGLVVLGEQFGEVPAVFSEARNRWADRIHAWGMASPEVYTAWLLRADAVVHAPLQEYFGYSVVEAMQAGCFPVLGEGGPYGSYAGSFPRWTTAEEAADALLNEYAAGFPGRQAAREAVRRFDPEQMQGPYARAVLDLVHPPTETQNAADAP